MCKEKTYYNYITLLCFCPSFVDDSVFEMQISTKDSSTITITKVFKRHRNNYDRKFHLSVEYTDSTDLAFKVSNTLMMLSNEAVRLHNQPVGFMVLKKFAEGISREIE